MLTYKSFFLRILLLLYDKIILKGLQKFLITSQKKKNLYKKL